jgi:hypothetical protein
VSATHSREFRSSSTSPSGLVVPERPDELFEEDPRWDGPERKRRISRRRRAALAFVVLAASSFGLGVLAAPDPAPADKAAQLVPANALLYVHASTAPGRESDQRLLALAERFSTFRALRDRAIRAVGGLDPSRDIRPWLGDEAAFALLPSDGPQPDPLLVAAVRDRPKAEALLERVRARGAGAAFSDDFLLIGSERAVRAALASRTPLADAPSYRDAAGDRPRERTLDAYASAVGLHELLRPPLRTLLDDRPGLKALGATLASADGGARVTLRAVGADLKGQEFEPTLIDRVPADVAAYVGVGGGSELQALVRRAGLGPLLDALRVPAEREAGVDVDRDLLGPLRGELALTTSSSDGRPVATLLARTRDRRRTRETMARLQLPVAMRLGPPEAPEPFQPRRIGGLNAFVLPATPWLQPAYSLDKDTLVASTQPAGLAHPRASLAKNPHFGRVLPSIGPRAEALVFIDLRQLLALGVLTGAFAPGLSADLADLRLVRAAGAVVRREKADTTAELFLEIP